MASTLKEQIQQAENTCFSTFMNYFGNHITDVKHPKDITSPIDLKVQSFNGNWSYWELKCMSQPHSKYKEVGYIIDTSKYETLLEVANTSDKKVFYCMFWADGKATVWDIKRAHAKYAPYISRFSTTMGNNTNQKFGAYLLSYNSCTLFSEPK